MTVQPDDHENFDRPAIVADKSAIRRFVQANIARLVERRIPFRIHASYNETIGPLLDAVEGRAVKARIRACPVFDADGGAWFAAGAN